MMGYIDKQNNNTSTGHMAKNIQNEDSDVVDKSLVTMFVKMSIEERLRANDNAVRTLMELRNAYQRKGITRTGSKPIA